MAEQAVIDLLELNHKRLNAHSERMDLLSQRIDKLVTLIPTIKEAIIALQEQITALKSSIFPLEHPTQSILETQKDILMKFNWGSMLSIISDEEVLEIFESMPYNEMHRIYTILQKRIEG